jgi:hypothetical protein
MYNFFQIGGMRAQKRLLNLLIDYWHPDAESFMLGGKSLMIIVEDIYFITGLSHRGEVPNFQARGGGGQTINDYINEYCDNGTEKRSTRSHLSRTIHMPGSTIPMILMSSFLLVTSLRT